MHRCLRAGACFSLTGLSGISNETDQRKISVPPAERTVEAMATIQALNGALAGENGLGFHACS